MDTRIDELGERVLAALYEENHGLKSNRVHIIAERALDARIAANQKSFELCDFKNKYGWCKLEKYHQGSHTVIFLGEDD